MRLTMVGTGYVGLVTGVCFSNTGNDVICLDIDPDKVERMKRAECPIYEPGLTELLEKNINAGRLHFTTDAKAAHTDAEMIFICVGTPSDERGHTDLRYIHSAADAIAEVLKELGPQQTPKTIVVKSTVPVGTTHAVEQRIRDAVGPDIPFEIANNPEFLKEGDAIRDFQYPDRVVCGIEGERSRKRFEIIYEPFLRSGKPLIAVDVRSSEMVKYASNNFLATKISFINETAALCEAYGADIDAVRRGMCSDPRIGTQFLFPGLGYGGSCFPKDTQACIMMGETSGTPAILSRSVHEVNERQRTLFFNKILKHFEAHGGLTGKTLAFWGLAFKPRTDDIREAPALTLIRKALGYGVQCRGFDPVAADNAGREIGPVLKLFDDMYEACEGADGVVISTDWDDFKTPDFDRLRSTLAHPVVFDGRNLYRPENMAEMGFHHHSIGRASALPR